mmetsp:Transcript_35074/g.81443  ORF Transcript_35074/g.81443 Transcript_35074/m.81443 type:complete len:189 (+) Transcript_35074:67-633(+)
MADELVPAMSAVSLEPAEEAEETSSEWEDAEETEKTASTDALKVHFKATGMPPFVLELDPDMAVRDVKKLATEHCNIEPEHMRIFCKDQLLKDADLLSNCKHLESGEPVRIAFTAGHAAMLGGSKPMPRNQGNPFVTPVRGIPGSKGLRPSRMSGRLGGMAIIRQYGIMMKRQEFREKAEQIGFVKYR